MTDGAALSAALETVADPVAVQIPVAHAALGGLGVGGLGGGLGGLGGVGAGGSVAEAVVAVELLLLLGGQVAVLGDVRRVLDRRLVVAEGDPVAGELGVLHRHEGLVGAEQPGAHRGPPGLVGVVVVVDLADLSDLVAGRVVGGGADEALNLALADRVLSPQMVGGSGQGLPIDLWPTPGYPTSGIPVDVPQPSLI